MAKKVVVSCSKCKFIEPFDKATREILGESNYGNCRRYAPQSRLDESFVLHIAWPIVSADDWCGEYEVKES